MDPVDASTRWHRWAVVGSENETARLLAFLDANLPAGWKRLTGEDLLPFQPFVREGSAWYSLDPPPARAGVTLSLERLKGSGLRGGGVWFPGPPQPTCSQCIPAAWDQVIGFLDAGIAPAARASGAVLRMPTSEEIFLSGLPSDVRDRLRAFSDGAAKSLPLGPEQADLWREFVVAAFQATAVIDARPFTRWLVANGWPQEAADALHKQFEDQSLLLARFADEVPAA